MTTILLACVAALFAVLGLRRWGIARRRRIDSAALFAQLDQMEADFAKFEASYEQLTREYSHLELDQGEQEPIELAPLPKPRKANVAKPQRQKPAPRRKQNRPSLEVQPLNHINPIRSKESLKPPRPAPSAARSQSTESRLSLRERAPLSETKASNVTRVVLAFASLITNHLAKPLLLIRTLSLIASKVVAWWWRRPPKPPNVDKPNGHCQVLHAA